MLKNVNSDSRLQSYFFAFGNKSFNVKELCNKLFIFFPAFFQKLA